MQKVGTDSLYYLLIGGSSDNPIYRRFPDTFHLII